MAIFSKTVTLIVVISALSLVSALSNVTSSGTSDERLVNVCAETNPGDKKITLECPAGTILKKMKAAAWGQNPGGCPSVKRHSKCTLDITEFMERYCLQSNKCPVTVTKEILGYPVDKQGRECLPDENPFTFVASFYCGIAGWNDAPPASNQNQIPVDAMPMDAMDNTSTIAPESTTKPQRSFAMSTSVSAVSIAMALVLAVVA